MIEWPDDDLAIQIGRSFANVAAAAMASATGMRFEVQHVEDHLEITTDDPKAIEREYGSKEVNPESWSVKGLMEAERMFNEQPQGGV